MIGGATGVVRSPSFLDCNGRRLFVLRFAPRDGVTSPHVVIFFAPFAEEMNRSRRMATLLGEALAGSGRELVVFDYFGTGESEGDFADARWDGWAADGMEAVRSAASRAGERVTVLGVRLGAALALTVAKACPEAVQRAVLWNPVLSGAMFLTQFLRLRLAATLGGSGNGETTQSLRARMKAGEALEIAGYTVDPQMAGALDAITADTLRPPASLRVDWMEVGGEDAALNPANRKIVDAWKAAGIPVREAVVPGEQFWATQEIATAPALIAETLATLEDKPE